MENGSTSDLTFQNLITTIGMSKPDPKNKYKKQVEITIPGFPLAKEYNVRTIAMFFYAINSNDCFCWCYIFFLNYKKSIINSLLVYMLWSCLIHNLKS